MAHIIWTICNILYVVKRGNKKNTKNRASRHLNIRYKDLKLIKISSANYEVDSSLVNWLYCTIVSVQLQ